MTKKDVGPSASAPVSTRGHFLRRRNNANTKETATCSVAAHVDAQPCAVKLQSASAPEIPVASGKVKRGIMLARKDVEIESGVEMLEDTIPTTGAVRATLPTDNNTDKEDGKTSSANPKKQRITLNLPLETISVNSESLPNIQGQNESSMSRITLFSVFSLFSTESDSKSKGIIRGLGAPIIMTLGFVAILIVPLHDFLRGVLATILFILLIDATSSYIRWLFEHFILRTYPERGPFKIPDYNSMPICEIPAAEEHKTIKTYTGWLNEANSYDPNTFSFSLTRSVYVRLDGTILKMSGTNARIPKRRMWNESPIDRTKVLFTDHRSYDLRECRIELLPLGLAKKRYFNRKYPIQLIIKNSCSDIEEPIEGVASLSDVSHKLDVKESKTPLNSSIVQGTTPPSTDEHEKPIDFGATVMQADLQQLRNTVNPDTELNDITVPCGDEVRLLLFTRCDREKEDWYRRFVNASKGRVHERDLQVPQARFIDDSDLQAAATRQAIRLTSGGKLRSGKETEDRTASDAIPGPSNGDDINSNTPDTQIEDMVEEDCTPDVPKEEDFEGLIMSSDVARNPADYVRFMTVYQNACNQNYIPVRKNPASELRAHGHRHRKSRRSKRQEDELWKGIDQSLFLGPSGSVVWANVLMGRCLFSWLHDTELHEKVKEFMQKKLNSIKLPSFMEEVIITNIYLGQSPVLIHRVSQPMLDERGVWLDADLTYEGLAHITVTTKLNLLRVRAKAKASPVLVDTASTSGALLEPPPEGGPAGSEEAMLGPMASVIYDSDAESSGGSSTESESPAQGAVNENAGGSEFFQNSPGNARRIFKIVDRIAASNLFQYATELPYVQRAMENMSANITLRVDLKGLVARGTLNVPPPPSDRIWMCFRGPPRLWISTKPQVGDKSVDWSIVTNVIESKLCEAVNKFLVYPNMVDFTIPFLSKPNYDDDPPMPSN